MIILAVAALAQQVQTEAPRRDFTVRHAEIGCWEGERTWTSENKPPSQMMVFRTDGDNVPARIEHHRDMFMEGGDVAESYNYIVYHFQSGQFPITARAYTYEMENVGIIFSNDQTPGSLQQARQRLADLVLCYLQKRFRAIDVLTVKGYERLWEAK